MSDLIKRDDVIFLITHQRNSLLETAEGVAPHHADVLRAMALWWGELSEAVKKLAARTTPPEALPIDLDHTPGDSAELIEMLRRLFDKSADAHDGDYPAKVGHALMAVYAYGRRRASIPSPLARSQEKT